jgi:NDP-sugar pyrophosphorylase family protein
LRLHPLTNADQPKCLLPVANAPALSYSLTALQKVGITTVFVVRYLPPVPARSLEQRVPCNLVTSDHGSSIAGARLHTSAHQAVLSKNCTLNQTRKL